MKNFQTILDAATSALAAQRPSQRPSDDSKERECALAQNARKIDQLRRVRLGSPEAASSSLVFEVVRHRGRWRTIHRGKLSAPYSDQSAAILARKSCGQEETCSRRLMASWPTLRAPSISPSFAQHQLPSAADHQACSSSRIATS
jgi:hypothetical protein